jgi:protein-arginine kinase activator protein McsA
MKYCRKCGIKLSQANTFPSQWKRADYICKSCSLKRDRNWYTNNSAKKYKQTEKNRFKRVYGFTREQWEILWNKQQGKCAICGKESALKVDHCHKTGKVRGLLCQTCNATLGMAYDSISILETAISYLKESYDIK